MMNGDSTARYPALPGHSAVRVMRDEASETRRGEREDKKEGKEKGRKKEEDRSTEGGEKRRSAREYIGIHKKEG